MNHEDRRPCAMPYRIISYHYFRHTCDAFSPYAETHNKHAILFPAHTAPCLFPPLATHKPNTKYSSTPEKPTKTVKSSIEEPEKLRCTKHHAPIASIVLRNIHDAKNNSCITRIIRVEDSQPCHPFSAYHTQGYKTKNKA